jgi:tetratricopeptide (TPR) repeat protein
MRRLWFALPSLVLAAGLARPVEAQRMKLPLSLKELEARAQKDSLDPAAHYNVALAYWNEKRYDDAERELKTAGVMDPKLAEAFLALAYLPYARRPKLWAESEDDRVPEEWKAPLEESNRLYRRAFLVNPLVDLRIIGATTPPKDSRWETLYPNTYQFYFQAFDDMLQGNYEQAHGRFVTLHRERRLAGPGQGKLPLFLYWYEGLSNAHTERWDEAVQSFEYLIGQDQQYLAKHDDELIHVPLRTNEYRYFLAHIQHAAGRTWEAMKLFQMALENDIGLYMAHVQMANMLEEERRWPEAIVERQRAIDANPDDASLLLDLGVTLGKAGRFVESEDALQRAAEANPRDARVPFWLGICQMEQNKRDDARATLTRFIAVAPSRWEKQIAMANQRLERLR